MLFSRLRKKSKVEPHDGSQSFCMFAHISLAKASHMAKLDVSGKGEVYASFREEQIT